MRIGPLELDVERLPAPMPMYRAEVDRHRWRELAAAVGSVQGRLISLWGAHTVEAGFGVCAAYATPDGLVWIRLALGEADNYPDLAWRFPFAARMERASADLLGITAQGLSDKRPWLNHGA